MCERERIVQGLLLEGWNYPEIGRRMGMNLMGVRQIVARVYWRNGIEKGEGRGALGRKFGVEVTRFGKGRIGSAAKLAV